jgi:hypothetical protein
MALAAQPVVAQPVAAQPVPDREVPAAGFRLTVAGGPGALDAAAFREAVAAALPERLTDPERNFMQDEEARLLAPYRLVLVFHGTADPPPVDLCVEREASAEAVEAPPPDPGTFGAQPTSVAAAFCRSGATLSTAHERISGGLTPGDAGFRFLIGDVVKQLFPDGFQSLPDIRAARAAGPAATR